MQQLYSTIRTWVSHYYYGSDEANSSGNQSLDVQQLFKLSKEEKIERLMDYLKNNINFPYLQQEKDRISMYFSEVLGSYESLAFVSVKGYVNYKRQAEKLEQQTPKTQYIAFYGPLNIVTESIKCKLMIQIVFGENFLFQMPIFHIENQEILGPSVSSTSGDSKNSKNKIQLKPNSKYCTIIEGLEKESKNYRAVLGGVNVKIPTEHSTWSWTQGQSYKKHNIKCMLDYCVDLFQREFPFVKKKTCAEIVDQQNNLDEQTRHLYELQMNLSESLKMVFRKDSKKQNECQLPDCVQNCQQLDILVRAQQSQYIEQSKENQKMRKFVQQMESLDGVASFEQFYPQISDKEKSFNLQTRLFDLICEIEATKDCLRKIQNFEVPEIRQRIQIEESRNVKETNTNVNVSKTLTADELHNFLQISKQLDLELFDKRHQLNLVVKQLQEEKLRSQ